MVAKCSPLRATFALRHDAWNAMASGLYTSARPSHMHIVGGQLGTAARQFVVHQSSETVGDKAWHGPAGALEHALMDESAAQIAAEMVAALRSESLSPFTRSVGTPVMFCARRMYSGTSEATREDKHSSTSLLAMPTCTWHASALSSFVSMQRCQGTMTSCPGNGLL